MRTPFLFALALMTATGCKAQLDDGDWDGDGFTIEDGDCNDDDALIYPGAEEACDGVDTNCDGEVSQPQSYYPDADQDGFGEDGAVQGYCDPPEGWVSVSGDCNDGDAAVNPDADEVCDAQDNDCDDVVDEDPPEWWYDADQDGFGEPSDAQTTCDPDSGYVPAVDGADCDDTDADIYPGAPELCDDVDQDCDKETRDDESLDALVSYSDTDTDGFGDPATAISSCDVPKGNVLDGTDCDDAALDIYPGAPEYCDGVDHDCDKLTNEDDAVDALAVWLDDDADGFGDPQVESTMCAVAKGFVENGDDCDDADDTSYPAAPELCDGIDHDCNGDGYDAYSTDAITFYEDTDDDDFGEEADTVSSCTLPSGYAAVFGDCNDNNDTIYPGAPEYCDGVDHDCDKLTNEDDSVDAGQYYTDLDEDGFGDDATLAPSCGAGPADAVEIGGDCNDLNNLIYPEAVEHCDGTDWDCDGLINEGESLEAVASWVDSDGDGYGDQATFEMVCTVTAGLVENADDCNDSSDLASPGIALETCNDWLDNNCDGHADECVLQDMSLSGADAVFEGASAGGKLGASLAGQVNLDGASTYVVIGANKDSAGDGAVYLLASDTLSAGTYDVSSSADAYILGSGSEQLGAAITAADLDADVQDELVVGAPGYDFSQGAVYFFEGTLSGNLGAGDASMTIFADAGGIQQFGAALSAAPYTATKGALLIGAPYDTGAAYLFTDPLADCIGCTAASDADSVFLGESTGDNAGTAVSVAGDVTCDGNADFMVGAPNHNGGDGAAYLMTTNNITAYDMKFAGINGFYTALGSSVVGLGDVDNDGCDDFAVGAPGDLSGVFVYLGDNSIDSGTTPERIRLLGSSDDTGTNVHSAGDIDNDGIADLLVATQDTVSLIYAATLFDGFDVADDSAVVVTGVGGSSDAGAALTNIGDVNEDGYADLFIGAPGTDSPNTDQGATYLLFGLGL